MGFTKMGKPESSFSASSWAFVMAWLPSSSVADKPYDLPLKTTKNKSRFLLLA